MAPTVPWNPARRGGIDDGIAATVARRNALLSGLGGVTWPLISSYSGRTSPTWCPWRSPPSATLVIYHLAARVNAAKDLELERYRTESTIRITAAQAEAAEAMRIAESERLARAELESQIAAAEARAAAANAIASQARLELAKLTEPRTIAPEDQEEIIAALKEFAGQHFGFSVFQDPEPLALLRVLDAVLTSAGWQRVPSQIGAIVVEAAGNTAGTSSRLRRVRVRRAG